MEQQPAHIERYTLTTALCMIVGICIGSGIFFKSDNILIATDGNVALGALMFFVAATTIVFGGLTLARFAMRTDGHGGIIAYAKEFLGPRSLTFIGWHYTLLYMPTIIAVVCWVVGVYACLAFNLPNSFLLQVGIGAVFMVLCGIWNMLWPTISGYAQNLATVAKVVPLIAVGVVGIVAGQPAHHLATGISGAAGAGAGWIAAAAPIAFAFDGWSSAVSIAPELKDARRNLPIALVAGPIIILALYLAYFLGLSGFLGPQTVMQAGDASLSLMFVKLLGEKAAALPNVIALVAVMGTANGMILATLRMPYALALHNEIPFSSQIRHVSPTLRFPVISACVALAASLLMLGLHTAVTLGNLLPNGDISEVAVALTMIILIPLYLRAIRLDPPAGTKRARWAIAPTLAIISSLAIGLSSLSNPTRWPFVIAHIAILILATAVMQKRKSA